MKGDFTRSTFEPKKRYHGVLQQQGRVQLDADWNEQNQIESYRTETGVSDMIGKSGGPLPAPGFEIKVTASKKELRIGPGHYYVDGVLCELDSEIAPDAQEDLPSTAKIMTMSTGPAAYTSTPETGIYLAYLDVWLHHLTAIERPEIRESALGGPDHATREKVMAHVKFVRFAAPGANINSISSTTVLNAITAPNLGKLNARTRPGKTSIDPCIVNPGAGYRRLENQLYRIEIHQSGNFNGSDLITNPTFKWSRDNGSITAKWDALNGNDLTASTPGRDKVNGFASGQLIELTDDTRETASEPGLLVQITSVKGNVITINPGGQAFTYAQFPKNPKIRRWDSPAAVRVRHNPDPQSNQFLTLEGEGGVEVRFAPGDYRTGDYWLIPARTSGPTTIGDIEWPRDSTPQKNPIQQPPHGIQHRYACLALVEFSSGEWKILGDCRGKYVPLAAPRLAYVSGDGQETMPFLADSTKRPRLPKPLIVGAFNSHWCNGVKLQIKCKGAAGRLAQRSLGDETGPSDPPVSTTDTFELAAPNGLVAVDWWLENDASKPSQQVEAGLFDAAGLVAGPLRFNANLSIAGQVSFDNKPTVRKPNTVQEAIEDLYGLVGQSPGVRVTAMRRVKDNLPLLNDTSVPADIFVEGLRFFCSAPVEPLTVKGRPTCSVTLELPYPFSLDDQNLWGRDIIGFQSVILDADTKAADNPPGIIWTPKATTTNWLTKKLFNVLKLLPNFTTVRAGRVLVRLRLEGNFIWAASDTRSNPKTYLDGDLKGKLTDQATDSTPLDLVLPSGDGSPGGTLEMWFWLIPPVPPYPGIAGLGIGGNLL